MQSGYIGNTLAPLALLFLCGCAGANHMAQPGERIQADFTCRLADGSLVDTTLAHVAGNEEVIKSPIFSLRDSYRPVKFTVAEAPETIQAKPFDPLEQKIGVDIAAHGHELRLNRTTVLELPSRQIDNFPARDRYLEMAMNASMPRLREMPVEEFTARYSATVPVIGAMVDADSDYPGVIRAISDEEVLIYFSVREGTKIPMAWGTAFINAVDDQTFTSRMDVHEGQLVPRIGGLPGRVSSVDAEKYTVDFAQTFAGETLYCEVSPRPFDPEQVTTQAPIDWIVDFDKGIELAAQQKKPMVLLLYSDECTYCGQMLDKVIPDPSLDLFRDSFIWLKINSEKLTEYADRFDQQGYPLTVILDADGGELVRLDGLQKVPTFAAQLDNILSPGKKG